MRFPKPPQGNCQGTWEVHGPLHAGGGEGEALPSNVHEERVEAGGTLQLGGDERKVRYFVTQAASK